MRHERTGSGSTTSIWMATAEMPEFPPLAQDLEADVCVVGAGISGLTTAYLLTQAGKRVVVLDDGPVAGGETSRTTAHFTAALDDFYHEIEEMHGREGARLAAESHRAAIDRAEAIVRAEGIECDFLRVDGYYFLGGGDSVDLLDRELEAAHRAGLADWERVERAPLAAFDTGPALRVPNQAQLHILRYLAGVVRAITRDGGRIFGGSHVSELDTKGSRPRVATTEGRSVSAGAIVFATNTPINDWVKIHTKQAPYRTYVIGARIPAGSVEPGLYWDTADPYHYLRLYKGNGESAELAPGSDVLIVGGEDHKTGQEDDPEERFRRLEDWTRERFKMVQSIDYRWSGQVMEPVDYMGFIGRNPGDEHIYIATGDSGNGMTHGTIAGVLLSDLILGRDNPWATLYDPSRVSLKAAPEFLKENINVAAQYRDYVTPGEVDSPDEVPAGEGRLMRDGAKKLAVYKDEGGRVHIKSAVCTHLYCIVNWNPVEKTWDCPCHGSRFDRHGKVVNGPAIAELKDPD